jgi:hypothetical protein
LSLFFFNEGVNKNITLPTKKKSEKKKKEKNFRFLGFVYHRSTTRVPVATKKKRYVIGAYPRSTICVPVPDTYPVQVLSLKWSTHAS